MLRGKKRKAHLTRSDRIELACSEFTPIETLIKLSQDKSLQVRMAVALNPNTPEDVLRKLAKSKEFGIFVWKAVAENPNTPVDVLILLAQNEDWRVREEVAWNKNTPAEVLKKLANDTSWGVRHTVTMNPNTPEDVLRKLAKEDKCWPIRKMAIDVLVRRGK